MFFLSCKCNEKPFLCKTASCRLSCTEVSFSLFYASLNLHSGSNQSFCHAEVYKDWFHWNSFCSIESLLGGHITDNCPPHSLPLSLYVSCWILWVGVSCSHSVEAGISTHQLNSLSGSHTLTLKSHTVFYLHSLS